MRGALVTKIRVINNVSSPDKEITPKSNRLPCRGCTKNCSDYDHCNGKPWRLINNKDSSRIRKT